MELRLRAVHIHFNKSFHLHENHGITHSEKENSKEVQESSKEPDEPQSPELQVQQPTLESEAQHAEQLEQSESEYWSDISGFP